MMYSQVTLMRGVLRLCRDGISLDDLKEYIRMRCDNPQKHQRVLRILRGVRSYGGFDWTLDERDGWIKIILTGKNEEVL